jgi:hypothetical protein
MDGYECQGVEAQAAGLIIDFSVDDNLEIRNGVQQEEYIIN